MQKVNLRPPSSPHRRRLDWGVSLMYCAYLFLAATPDEATLSEFPSKFGLGKRIGDFVGKLKGSINDLPSPVLESCRSVILW